MSARKPDAWRVANSRKSPFALRKTEPRGWGVIETLYALSESDLEAIRQAAALIENMSGITAGDEALAAALRSIVEGKGT